MYWSLMEIKATIADIVYSFVDFLKKILKLVFGGLFNFLKGVFSFIRSAVYNILCLLKVPSYIAFIFSFYFFYKCYNSYKVGVNIFLHSDFKYAIMLFFIPIALSIVIEFLKPAYYK